MSPREHAAGRSRGRKWIFGYRSVDWPWALLALLCVIGLVAAVVILSGSDRMSRGPLVNGDALGPGATESVAAYVARADASLSGLDDAGGDPSRHWALVSFLPAQGPRESAAAVEGIPGLRVAQLVVGAGGFRALPEPIAGENRADVLAREFDTYVTALNLPAGTAPGGVSGLVIEGMPEQLREIRTRPGVTAVEALPAGAVAGHFGVRPLTDANVGLP